MTTYAHAGIDFVLDVTHTDVTGVDWEWSGDYNANGEPLMGSLVRGSALLYGPLLPLPDLHEAHGPLLPTPRAATALLYRRALQAVTR